MRDSGARVERWAPVLAVLLGTLLWPSVWWGVPPHSADHNVHLANAVEAERLLRSGRLVGWSDFQFAGHPANAFYPPLASLTLAGLHLLTGGVLGWDGSYAVVLGAFLGGFALALFVLLRPVLGPLWTLGVLALCLFVDRGGTYAGGRHWYLDMGVWPFGASVALVLAVLARLPRYLVEGGRREALVPGVLWGLALLFHPFALVLFFPLAALQGAFFWREAGGWRPVLLRGLAVSAVGLGLAAWWLIPFLLRAPQAEHVGAPPLPLAKLGSGVWGGELVPGLPGWVGPLALLGSAVAWRKGGAWGRWLVLATWGALVLTTDGPYRLLGLEKNHTLEGLQVMRFRAVGRLLLGGLAGLAGRECFLAWRARRWWTVGTLGLLSVAGVGTWRLRGGDPPGGTSEPPKQFQCYTAGEEAGLARLLHDVRPRLGEGRLALYSPSPHSHCLVLAVPWLERPFFKVGYTPATVFGGKFSTTNPLMLGRLGVTAVLMDASASGPLGGLPVLARQGRFEVREVRPLPRVGAVTPGAQARVLSWEDEAVRLRLTGPEPTEILLWMDWAPEWHATREGQEVPLEPALVEGARLMKLRAGPGEVVLRFGPSRGARPAALLSVLTVLAMAWAALSRPRRPGVSAASS
ncbi:hypothetical protein [Archangium sp.]|uniref:hypothetical protein n=1 Tax=Archangium sp. TaxID=1872627 RepID=UPI00389ABC9C